MPILNIETSQTGEAGVLPSYASILTNDTEAAVLTAGYLNQAVQNGASFQLPCIAKIATKASASADYQVGWYQIVHVAPNWSVVPSGNPGDVTLPTIANHIATYTNTTGTLAEDAATAINGGNIQAGLSGTAGYLASFPATLARGSLRLVAANSAGDFVTQITNASQAAARVLTIPDGGQTASNFIISNNATTQVIATGALQLSAGALISGLAAGGFVGLLKAFPTTGSKGFVAMQAAVNATGDFGTTISNAIAQGQAQVVSIPDAGAATANFLLDTGAANILAEQQFIGLSNVLAFSAGTWTTTRIAAGNYGSVKSQADETAIIGIDITPIIRVAASKGFRLDSFDVIYGIATLALDAHSVALSRVAYADNVAVSVTSIPVTATLATATQANPYVTAATVDTPAFDVTADSKYVIEVTVDAGATSDYTYYGVMLKFSQTIG